MNPFMAAAVLFALAPIERTVAIVDDMPVLHSEVMEVLSGMGLETTGGFETDSRTAEYRDALEELVERSLIAAAARDAGLYPSESEIQALVEREIAANPGLMDADRDLLADYIAGEQALQVFLGRKVYSAMTDIPLSPRAYLEANSDLVEDMVMPRRLAWIYIPVLPSGPELERATEEILSIREQILRGEPFEEMAMRHSDDGSARNGGYLGTFGPGEMTYAFEDVAFSLDTGQISEPVATPFGVHIIRLEERHQDGRITASHILRVVSPDTADVRRTLDMADSIRSEIVAGVISFEEAARRHSGDRSSSAEGGDLGIIPLRFWQPGVERVAAELETGGITPPLFMEDVGGVALFKLLERAGNLQWDLYSTRELEMLVQQVVFTRTRGSVVDSLRREIPVVYLIRNDVQDEG